MAEIQYVESDGGAVYLKVRVQPKASRNAVRMEADGRVRVAVTAPATDGAANAALREFLAKFLGIPKRSVSLVSGEKSREKTLRMEGVSLESAKARLGLTDGTTGK